MCFAANIGFYFLAPFIPLLLDKVNPLNETRPLEQLLEVQYYVDPEKYYIPIYIHGAQGALSVVFIILTVDVYFMMITQHACSMFVVLGYNHALRSSIFRNLNNIHIYLYF